MSPSDLVVVGAGIVGLAHAVAAVDRGLSVTVVERDDHAVGASVRNFGHGCVTGQVGEAQAFALRARTRWLRLAREAGFWARESGTVVVARSAEESAALEELAAAPDVTDVTDVTLLGPAALRERAPVAAAGLRGGAFLPADVRIDPRGALPAIAAWLEGRPGVRVLWSTAVTAVEPGTVRTTRGPVAGRRIVVCVGHDLDRLFPAVAEEAGIRRCALRMLQVRPPAGTTVDPALLTGTSLLRYPAFARTEGARRLRSRLERERPDLLAAAVNHMLTQRPDGDLVIGDTHAYAGTLDPVDPLDSERLDDLVRAETAALLDLGPLPVVHRWTGVYASAPDREFLRVPVAEGVRAVTVTTGIGMTTAFGLAEAELDAIMEGTHA
jgi:D-hydroxyproline dehydrogenase subunit beta